MDKEKLELWIATKANLTLVHTSSKPIDVKKWNINYFWNSKIRKGNYTVENPGNAIICVIYR